MTVLTRLQRLRRPLHLRRRPMAWALHRSPVGVKPVAACCSATNQLDVVQHHRRSQRDRLRRFLSSPQRSAAAIVVDPPADTATPAPGQRSSNEQLPRWQSTRTNSANRDQRQQFHPERWRRLQAESGRFVCKLCHPLSADKDTRPPSRSRIAGLESVQRRRRRSRRPLPGTLAGCNVSSHFVHSGHTTAVAAHFVYKSATAHATAFSRWPARLATWTLK